MSASSIVKDIKNQIFKGVESKPVGEVYLALVRAFPLTKISTQDENETALSILDRLMTFVNEHEKNIEPKDRLQLSQYMICLGSLIEEFEREAFPGSGKHVSGREMLAYLMETHDLTQADLKNELGGQSVVSELLSGDREFNIRQVRALSERFKVSPLAFFG